MQPTLRHVPPNVPLDSIHAVFNPSWAALIAPTYPPGPPPITKKSNSSMNYNFKKSLLGSSKYSLTLTKNETASFPSIIL